MTESEARVLIQQHAGKAIRQILTVKDAEVDEYLPPDVARRFRKTVMDAVNRLADVCCVIADGEREGTMVNVLAIEQLSEIYRAVVGGDP